MEVDVILIVLFVGAFMLGVLRGALRQLIVLGAWLVTFLVAAYLRPPVANWIIANGHQYSAEYAQMLAFVALFVLLFGLAVTVIQIGGHTIQLSQRVAVDEILGGFLMLGAALLAVAALAIAVDSYYARPHEVATAEFPMVSELNLAFQRSAIVQQMHNALIPGLMAILGPILPADIRLTYA